MGHLIVEIRGIDQKKRRVCFEDGTAVPVYEGELRKFQIREGELPEPVYQELMAVVQKRARIRCLHLLEKADRTEAQLRTKLRESHYPNFLVEDALEYAKSFHYVDDARYARNYVALHGTKKSRRQLMQELQQKGISGELAAEALEEEGVDEEASIYQLAVKKVNRVRPEEPADWQKIYRYLAGKGYSYQKISGVINRLQAESGAENSWDSID